jgi:hypothetical protein
MKLYLALAAGILALTGTAAVAQGDEQASQQESEKDRLVCKSEKVTGSRARVKRVCLTREQWGELAAETKDNIDQYSRKMTSTREGAGQAQ